MENQEPMESNASQASEVAEYGDYRFQDPQWVAWWLTSLYMLTPNQQIDIALRILNVVHSIDVQAVLRGFIEYQSPMASQVSGGEDASEVSHAVTESMETPTWTGVLRSAWARYPIPLIGASLAVLIYAFFGLKSIFTLLCR